MCVCVWVRGLSNRAGSRVRVRMYSMCVCVCVRGLVDTVGNFAKAILWRKSKSCNMHESAPRENHIPCTLHERNATATPDGGWMSNFSTAKQDMLFFYRSDNWTMQKYSQKWWIDKWCTRHGRETACGQTGHATHIAHTHKHATEILTCCSLTDSVNDEN